MTYQEIMTSLTTAPSKIHLIKEVREIWATGFKEAKDLVDGFDREFDPDLRVPPRAASLLFLEACRKFGLPCQTQEPVKLSEEYQRKLKECGDKWAESLGVAQELREKHDLLRMENTRLRAALRKQVEVMVELTEPY